MTAYYNEIDPYCAAWLRNLIAAGHIAPGDVDTRSIEDVTPSDLAGYAQCHFFAGIGVWSYALRLAGWPDDRPVWTGSCPCQPFSAAGQGRGLSDERHLWPAWHYLIEQCRPPVVFGEQVAAALAWLELVQADLEAAGYSVGALDLCAAGVGAPHIRQRLYFVGHTHDDGERAALGHDADGRGEADELAYADGGDAGTEGIQRGGQHGQLEEDGSLDWLLADTDSARRERRDWRTITGSEQQQALGTVGRGAAFWGACEWLPCTDGKARPVEPGTFPLAHGAPARVGRLRAYGNAIVAPLAKEFIGAFLDVSR